VLSSPDCWTSDVQVLFFLLEATFVNREFVENLGLITVQSSHIPEIRAARDRSSG
jgi:hypothetical protein